MKKSIYQLGLRTLIFGSTSVLLSLSVNAQITFENSTPLLPVFTNSGNAITVMDMDGDGLDDIAVLDDANILSIFKQVVGQNFVHIPGVSMSGSNSWSMVAGDVNDDGMKDVMAGFGSSATLALSNGTGFNPSTVIPNSNFFLQNMNLMDVDNDGDIDIMGCNDVGLSKIWVNNGMGVFAVSSIIDFNVTPTDDSGNYGSIWSDFDNDGDLDLYIAKCRQGVTDTSDARRINVLFKNNGNGTFTESAIAHGLRINSQSWTANFEDINNDGWFDALVTNHDKPTQLLLNNGAAFFTDINTNNGAGLNVSFTPYQSKMADFDNDGFVDVLITGSTANSASARLFRNNGDNTFSPMANALPTNKTVQSFGIGDLNHDGKLDIFAGYATGYNNPSSIKDILWINSTENNNHFVAYNLQGTISNSDAVGARVFIYGPWGVQTREVRIGESYGNCNSLQMHFGLGSATNIDSVVVNWPSGIITRLTNQAVDQVYHIVENDCVSPQATITPIGSPFLCNNATVTLSAPAGNGYTYLWSTGDITQNIQVSNTGVYSVRVSSGNCKTWSPSIQVESNPDQTPHVTIVGDSVLCEGQSVDLQGPNGMFAYAWSNGATTQNTTVSTSGVYTLTVTGYCEDFTSAPIEIEVLTNPTPMGINDTVFMSGSGTLFASGSSIEWYDALTGGNLLASGNNFNTPVLNTTTTFYAQNNERYIGDTLNVGEANHLGVSNYSGSNNTNAITYFEVFKPLKIVSFKVYSDTPGNRLIEVKDQAGNVVAEKLIYIPNTAAYPNQNIRINVNLELNPGMYNLSTNADTNLTSLGYNGPRLRRTSGPLISYPFSINNNISITGSSEGAALYYYFYDWEVELSKQVCVSERTPVDLVVLTDVGLDNFNSLGLEVYPNPTLATVQLKSIVDLQDVELHVFDMFGKNVMSLNKQSILANNPLQIDLGNFSKGIYLIKISNKDQVKSLRIIKQ